MWRAVLLLLIGCNQIYGLEGTSVDSPTECSGIRFGAPQHLPQFENNPTEFDAQISDDGLELWFVYAETNGAGVMYRGVRASVADRFVVELAMTDTQNRDTVDPSMTADGTRLMFVLDEDNEVHEGVRTDPKSAVFDRIQIVAGLVVGNTTVDSLDLSWDGHRIYYTLGGELWFAERPTLDKPFENNVMLFRDVQFPSVSPDELEIFYNHDEDQVLALYRRTRTSRDQPFGAEEFILDVGEDPDVAPSSTTLVIGREHGLAILERTCP